MQQFEVQGHEPSLLPEGWEWKLAWSDEFDGTKLDESKWDYRLSMFHCRHNTFTTEGVELKGDSCVRLNLVEKDGQYYSPHLQTGYNFMDEPLSEKDGYSKFTWPIAKLKDDKFTHLYGYYECRCQLQQQPGWWSAFWMQSPTIGCCKDPSYAGIEVDIMECFEPNKVITPCMWWNGYGADLTGIRVRDPENTGAGTVDFTPGFHYFGLLWEPDGYTFYYDGKPCSRKVTEAVSHRPEFLLISTECKGYRAGDCPDEELKKAVLPDAFIVDHVRVFDPVGGFNS